MGCVALTEHGLKKKANTKSNTLSSHYSMTLDLLTRKPMISQNIFLNTKQSLKTGICSVGVKLYEYKQNIYDLCNCSIHSIQVCNWRA